MTEDWKQYQQVALREALSHPGLNEAEYYILREIIGDFRTSPESLAESCLSHGWPGEKSTYLEAVESLVQKGYACILNRETIKAIEKARAAEKFPSFDESMPTSAYQPGVVEASYDGYFVYRTILYKMYGEIFVDLMESRSMSPYEGAVRVYSAYESRGMKCKIGEVILRLMQRGKKITEIHQPVRIGEWRPNRFITHSRGCYVCIDYTPWDKYPDV